MALAPQLSKPALGAGTGSSRHASIRTPAGGLRTEGMGDGWMIRGSDAEKEARIPALMEMPALPASGSLAPRSLCPRCHTPALWSPATPGIPPAWQLSRVHAGLGCSPTPGHPPSASPGLASSKVAGHTPCSHTGLLSPAPRATSQRDRTEEPRDRPSCSWPRAESPASPWALCSAPCRHTTGAQVAMEEVFCYSSAPSPPLMIIQPYTSL